MQPGALSRRRVKEHADVLSPMPYPVTGPGARDLVRLILNLKHRPALPCDCSFGARKGSSCDFDLQTVPGDLAVNGERGRTHPWSLLYSCHILSPQALDFSLVIRSSLGLGATITNDSWPSFFTNGLLVRKHSVHNNAPHPYMLSISTRESLRKPY